jgi:sulfur-oxidizing protein SoxZ
MGKARIKVPETAKVGDVIEIKTLIAHVMETGQRKERDGTTVPRNIIHTFVARFAGKPFFQAHLQPGISANPYISFYMRVPGPGEFEFVWTDDSSAMTIEKVPLTVV